jgi:hypothetical protein
MQCKIDKKLLRCECRVFNARRGGDQIVKDKEMLVKGFMERNKEDEHVFGIIDGTALNVSKC